MNNLIIRLFYLFSPTPLSLIYCNLLRIYRLNFAVQNFLISPVNVVIFYSLSTYAKLIAYFQNLYLLLDKEHRQMRCAIYFT